jgi:hypothetical protein
MATMLWYLGTTGGFLGRSLITYRPPEARRAPLTLAEAADNVRRFVGDQRLQLEGGLVEESAGGQGIPLFHLESVRSMRGEDSYKVDSETGEVVEATMRSRLVVEPTNPVDDAAAYATAERFARDRFFDFDGMSLVDATSRVSEGTNVFSFKWTARDDRSGAELPVSVSVVVSSTSGQVVWYLAQRDDLEVSPVPGVDREQAIARAAASVRDPRWDPTNPSSVRLQVLYDDDNQQRLVWSIVFPARTDAARGGLRRLIDAHSGEPIVSG